MARISAGSGPLDMLQYQFAYVDANAIITDATYSSVTVRTPSGNTQVLTGNFYYNANGFSTLTTITGLSESANGNTLYTISGFSMSFQVWANFVLNNDAAGQRRYILGGAAEITGSDYGDRLAGDLNSDQIDGRDGFDIAVFRGSRANFAVTRANGKITVTDLRGNDGTDTLTSIEMLQFDDVSVVVNNLPVVS